MVNVKQQNPEKIRDWADQQIPYLVSCWNELPQVYAEMESWDAGEVQSYVEEWPLYEMTRQQLEEASQKQILTAEQEAQMDTLRTLSNRHGPLLRELLGS